MKKKTFGKRLEAVVKKAGTQLPHRAEELSKFLHTAAVDVNNAGVNQTLQPVRHDSKDILDAMILKFNDTGKLLVQSRTTVDEFQTKFQNLEKQAQEIKHNQEIVTQLQRLRNGNLAMVNGAMTASELAYTHIVQDNLISKATVECNAISNAPKESAPKAEAAGAGADAGPGPAKAPAKAPEYSKDGAKKLADEALKRLKNLQATLATACQDISQHHDYIKASKDAIEKALKEISDKIAIFSAYEAARPAAVSEQQALLVAMQEQFAKMQAEITSLRAAAGLGNTAAAAAPQLGLAFTPMASALPAAGPGAGAAAMPTLTEALYATTGLISAGVATDVERKDSTLVGSGPGM